MSRTRTTLQKGNYISITELAKRVGTTAITIKRWYVWYEDDTYEKPDGFTLPEYVYLDNMNTKYFHIKDVDRFKEICKGLCKSDKYRGIMSDYTKNIKRGKDNEQKNRD